MRPLFTWKFSGVLVPFFFGMGYATMTYHQFVMAYVLSISGGIWSLGYYLYSDPRRKRINTVSKLREAAGKHETAAKIISKYKRARTWHYCKEIGTSAAVLIVTCAFLFWLSLGQKEYELSLSDGWLLPANDPTPPNACDHIPGGLPKGALKILVGDHVFYSIKFPAPAISINDDAILTIDRNERGELAITTDIYDQSDDIVTQIIENRFKVSQDVFDRPRPDLSSLKVVIKRHKETVLDIRYMNPTTMRIIGIFRHRGDHPIVVTADEMRFKPLDSVYIHGNCYGGGIRFVTKG